MLTILKRLQTSVLPALRAEVLRSRSSGSERDRLMIQVTLAGIDTNSARLLDALADLYTITRTRDLAQHGAEHAVFREFPMLSQSGTWLANPGSVDEQMGSE
ncbi:MAG: hypothetical protein EA383_02370 [Spirochaetaceae bacterium]|nr:MAG: hypothetical protein EA383_02370 [Spirochaetaceae bacterium]